jgi:hsdA (fragment)
MLNDNLLDTAQTIIKDSMVENSQDSTVGDIIELFDSMRKPMSSLERSGMERIYPYYGAAALMDYVDDYIFDGIFGLLGEDGTVMDDNGYPTMQYVWGKFWVNNHAHIFQGKNGYSTEFAYLILGNTIVRDAVTGAVQLKINQENLRKLPIQLPTKENLKSIEATIQPLLQLYRNNCGEILRLNQMTDIMLEKMSA